MTNKDAILKAAGNSLAAYEMREYLCFDTWEEDPEIRKDETDFILTVGGLQKRDGKEELNPDTGAYSIDLCGQWKLSSQSIEIMADVPGSIHTACMNAGIIEDPYVGLNDAAAHKLSGREWVYEKNFIYEGTGKHVCLTFDGVCDRCEVYINDILLGAHQGMFGGPRFDISEVVRRGINTLRVKLLPALYYNQTVVFNCSDGWHYAKIWPLGIWNRVHIDDLPRAYCENPFISTYDCVQGTLELSMPVSVTEGSVSDYGVRVVIAPKNFTGSSYAFECKAAGRLRVRFDLPEFRLWWPNGSGEQNLYTLYVQIMDRSSGARLSQKASTFGIRSIEAMPYPSGEKPSQYNRTLVINREGIFMKGAGWCTIDALMRFDRPAYDRILSRAKQQGINFMRAWGGGLSETEDFYDLCDEYGICVYQEWPCCWDSHIVQPADVLYETVRLNTIRMRNHPSLVLYGGGNEGNGSFQDAVLNRIGKITYEYDGTRPFYRQDGGAAGRGIAHDHIHWGGELPEHYMTVYSKKNEINMHEYGLDSFMNLGSVRKYATPQEILEWPIRNSGVIGHHTATFNGAYGWSPTPHGFDIDTLKYYANLFLAPTDILRLSIGSQLAQTLAVVPAIMNSRIKWPNCTLNAYYKFNDIYPGSSWSVVDWYGAPKIAHYFCQDAQAPLMAGGLMERYNTYDQPIDIPVYILDDNRLLEGKQWRAAVTLYDSSLIPVKGETYDGTGFNGKSHYAGIFHADACAAEHSPFFIVFDLYVDGKISSRYYMPLNFDYKQVSLFTLPQAQITFSQIENAGSISGEYDALPEVCGYDRSGTDPNKAFLIRNESNVPAVGVHFICPDSEASFVCSDNYFWLMPGESKLVYVNHFTGVKGLGCLNYAGLEEEMSLFRRQPQDNCYVIAEGASEDCHSVRIRCNMNSTCNSQIGYNIYVDGTYFAGVPAGSEGLDYVCGGLCESRPYRFQIAAVDAAFREFAVSEIFEVSVLRDMEAPQALCAFMKSETSVAVMFSKAMDPKSAAAVEHYKIDGAAVLSAALLPDHVRCIVLHAKPEANRNLSGATLHIAHITDCTENRNSVAATQIPVEGCFTEDDFIKKEGESVRFSKRGAKTYFSIGEGARIRFKVKSDGVKEYRVLLAKCAKTDRTHFEVYLRPTGELYLFSNKGDYGLDVNIDDAVDFTEIDIHFKGDQTVVFCNGKQVKILQNAIVREETPGMLSLCGLNNAELPFRGELKDIALYTWCMDSI